MFLLKPMPSYNDCWPQGQRISALGFARATFWPAAHIAYFRAVHALLVAPFLEVGVGSAQYENLARPLEIEPSLVEGGGRSVRVFARIEAAGPAPCNFVARNADAPCDRADLHIAIDVPAVRAFGVAATGEGVHCL